MTDLIADDLTTRRANVVTRMVTMSAALASGNPADLGDDPQDVLLPTRPGRTIDRFLDPDDAWSLGVERVGDHMEFTHADDQAYRDGDLPGHVVLCLSVRTSPSAAVKALADLQHYRDVTGAAADVLSVGMADEHTIDFVVGVHAGTNAQVVSSSGNDTGDAAYQFLDRVTRRMAAFTPHFTSLPSRDSQAELAALLDAHETTIDALLHSLGAATTASPARSSAAAPARHLATVNGA